MLETMGEDYIRTARAKGLPERTVVVKHGLRAALTPILTIFGLDLGLLLGGAILTESTFSLPGIGKYSIDAMVNNDLPKVLGVVLVGSLSSSSPTLSSTCSTPWSTRGCGHHERRVRGARGRTDGARPFLDVRDLRVRFPTDDGVVKAVDGLSFSLERGSHAGHRRRVRARARA